MKIKVINIATGEVTEQEATQEEMDMINAGSEPEVQPTLEQRVADIEQVTEEVITALNDKGIVP